MRHFWPGFNGWLQELPDSRFEPGGLAISIGSEFIENPAPSPQASDAIFLPTRASSRTANSQPFFAWLLASRPLSPKPASASPPTRSWPAAPVMSLCEQYHWSYVLTFKSGRTPALWQEFLALLPLSPQNRLRQALSDGTLQVFRWVNDIAYSDSDKRTHILSGLLCEETDPKGQPHTFAWITEKHLHSGNISNIATRAGRSRFIIENQGFNIQKNGGLNLEHAYSTGEDTLKSF